MPWGRNRKPIIIGVSVVLVAALAAGVGVAAYRHSASVRLAEAKSSCAESSETLRVAMNQYNTLHDGKATEAAKITDKQVEDAKTVATLAKAMETKTPELAACDVQGVDRLDEVKARIDETAAWYGAHTTELTRAVDAVNRSHDAKTLKDAKDTLFKQVKDAQAKYKATGGKVKDDKTRKELKAMIDKASKTKDGTDAEAMNAQAKRLKDLMGKVDASVKAKQDAERKAAEEQARKETEAQAAAAAQAQAQASTPQYTAPQQSYTAPQQVVHAPVFGTQHTPIHRARTETRRTLHPQQQRRKQRKWRLVGIGFSGGCGADFSGCTGTYDGINHNGF